MVYCCSDLQCVVRISSLFHHSVKESIHVCFCRVDPWEVKKKTYTDRIILYSLNCIKIKCEGRNQVWVSIRAELYVLYTLLHLNLMWIFGTSKIGYPFPFPPQVVYSNDRSTTAVLLLFGLCVALWWLLAAARFSRLSCLLYYYPVTMTTFGE